MCKYEISLIAISWYYSARLQTISRLSARWSFYAPLHPIILCTLLCLPITWTISARWKHFGLKPFFRSHREWLGLNYPVVDSRYWITGTPWHFPNFISIFVAMRASTGEKGNGKKRLMQIGTRRSHGIIEPMFATLPLCSAGNMFAIENDVFLNHNQSTFFSKLCHFLCVSIRHSSQKRTCLALFHFRSISSRSANILSLLIFDLWIYQPQSSKIEELEILYSLLILLNPWSASFISITWLEWKLIKL